MQVGLNKTLGTHGRRRLGKKLPIPESRVRAVSGTVVRLGDRFNIAALVLVRSRLPRNGSLTSSKLN